MTRPIDNPVVFAAHVLGTVPHAGQAAYLRDERRTKVLAGGRRAGKTLALAIELCYWAVRAHAERRPFRQLVVAPAIDQAKLLFSQAVRLLRDSAVGGLIRSEVATPFPELRFDNDIAILVRGAHEGGRHLRGHAAHRVVVDEAAYLGDPVIQEAIFPTLADVGGQLVLASTPRGRCGLFHALYARGRSGDPEVASFLFRSEENPHIDRAFVDGQRRALTASQWAAEYRGEFIDPGDVVFPWDQIATAAVASAEGPRTGRRYVIGWDPAKRRDGSAVAVLDATEGLRRVVHVEDIAGRSYTVQVDRVAALAAAYRAGRVVVDATGLGDPVVDLLRGRGVVVEPFRFTNASKADLVQSIALALEQRTLLIPPDPRLIDELRDLRAERTQSGAIRYEASPGASDDRVFAVALALHGAGPAGTGFAEAGLMPFITRGAARARPFAVRPGRDPVAAWFQHADAEE